MDKSDNSHNSQRDYSAIIFMTVLNIFALYALFGIIQAPWRTNTNLLGVVLMVCSAIAIGGGYHRYYAHRTHKASWLVQAFHLIFGAGTFQSSAWKWGLYHRDHHHYTDTDRDPYGIHKGAWWAHMGWIFHKRPEPSRPLGRRDPLQSGLVAWQKKYYYPLAVFMAFVLPAVIASFWGDAWGGFKYAGVLRVAVFQHCTFLVNSLAHMWGKRVPGAGSARNGGLLVALLTWGEGGNHADHHAHPSDYRIGRKWYNYDPSKWFIWTLSLFRATSSLRRAKSR